MARSKLSLIFFTVLVFLLFTGINIISLINAEIVREKSLILILNGNTLYVGGDGPGNYSRIQDAVDNATNGDTVFVYNGVYHENIVINITINLIGEDKNYTIIDGRNRDDVVHVTADRVNISRFMIRNSGHSWGDSGIDIQSNFNTISNAIITDNDDGIHKSGGHLRGPNHHNMIYNNIIVDNRKRGIYFDDSYNNTIFYNIIEETTEGIQLYFSDYNHVYDNLFNDTNYSISLSNSYNNLIFRNVLDNSSEGISLISSCGNQISENDIANNKYSGIELTTSNQNTVFNNTINKNSAGFELRNSHNNIFSGNILTQNKYGIRSWDSTNNIFSDNSIFGSGYVAIELCDSENNRISNNTINNLQCGISLSKSFSNTITKNEITDISEESTQQYRGGIELKDSSGNNICYNIFKNNRIHAHFYNFIYSPEFNLDIWDKIANSWKGNYWGRSRFLPKPIFGIVHYRTVEQQLLFPLFQVDWRPAKEPYHI